MVAQTPKSKSKQGVPLAKYPHKRFSTPADTAGNPSFVLCDPAQTTDDFQEDCLEKSPKFTILGGLCTNATSFDAQDLKVHTVSWAIPHLLQITEHLLKDDPRGALVLLKESQVSFRNVSANEVVLHANTPVAKSHSPDAVYARASGFRKNGSITDDVLVKPGETITYSVSWERMQGYVPMTTVKSERLWMNMITFCVEMKNISNMTGSVIPEVAEVLTIIPKSRYWKRKSNPVPFDEDLSIAIEMQDGENFGVATLGGISDLYKVTPIDCSGGGDADGGGGQVLDSRYVRDNVQFTTSPGRVIQCQDAYNEGDLLGIAGLNLGDYTTAALKVRTRAAGTYEYLKLMSRRSDNIRIMVQGLNISSDDRDPSFSYSYFKFVKELGDDGAWVLWDEDREEPRSADPKLGIETVLSSFVPITVINGLRKKPISYEGRYNTFGQPYGDPKNFADFIKKSISIIGVISKIAVATGFL
jgi:hypothetical protein